MTDIMQAKQNIESMLVGLVSGTGVSYADKSIIIYIPDPSKEQQIRSRVGSQYEGYNLRFVISGNVVSFQ